MSSPTMHTPPSPTKILIQESPVKGDTLAAQIYSILEHAIIQGEIPSSSRLHPDDLASQYGTSRIPVREALRALHEAGWVDIRPRQGVYVRERSITELRELFEARAGLEEHIASLAAQRRTSEDLEQLRRIASGTYSNAKSGDVNAKNIANAEFNEVLRNACQNSVLADLSTKLEKRARFYFSMIEEPQAAAWAGVQQSLLKAIEQNDPSGAGQIANKHVVDTGLNVAKLLENH